MQYSSFRIIFFITIVLFTGSNLLFSQSNHIPLKGKSFLGALELMPDGKLAQGSYRVKSPFPGELDPMLDPYKWYVEGDEQVCGMVGDAVLYLEWWIKGSEPLERYKFDWTSSGYFDVKYKNDKGDLVSKRINWFDLEKYPNLKKRFELIQPYNIGFQFTFHTGDKSEKDYYGFRERYGINEDLGSAGYAVDYTRKISTWKVVHVRGKEKKNWGNPAILLGGWKEFCPLADKHKDKESRLLELFRMGRTLVISHKITEMQWRVSDFVYIAKKFEAYESGKEKPDALEQVEEGKDEEKAGDESWDETTDKVVKIDKMAQYSTQADGEFFAGSPRTCHILYKGSPIYSSNEFSSIFRMISDKVLIFLAYLPHKPGSDTDGKNWCILLNEKGERISIGGFNKINYASESNGVIELSVKDGSCSPDEHSGHTRENYAYNGGMRYKYNSSDYSLISSAPGTFHSVHPCAK